MINKSNWLCLGLLWLSFSCLAQKDGKIRRLVFENGLNLQTVLDQRFTANAQTHFGFHTKTGFEFGKNQRLNRFEIHFAKNFVKRDLTFFTNLHSGFRYTHLRPTKMKQLKLGAYLDVGSLLIFPDGQWSENNPISYTIWSSLGMAAHWEKPIMIKQKKMTLSIEGALPLLSYVIRPAHAHPYPDNYLVDGVFDFEQKEMAKYLIKSGKLKTLNQFNNFIAQTTLTVPFGKKEHQIGLSYNWSLLWKGSNQKLWFAQQQLSLTFKIVL